MQIAPKKITLLYRKTREILKQECNKIFSSQIRSAMYYIFTCRKCTYMSKESNFQRLYFLFPNVNMYKYIYNINNSWKERKLLREYICHLQCSS